jgi:hypothetical protein
LEGYPRLRGGYRIQAASFTSGRRITGSSVEEHLSTNRRRRESKVCSSRSATNEAKGGNRRSIQTSVRFPARRFSNTQAGSERFAKFSSLLLSSTGYKSVDLIRSAWKRFVLILQPLQRYYSGHLHARHQQGQAGRSESTDGGHDEARVGELKKGGLTKYRRSLPVCDNPLGNPCAKGDDHSSVAIGITNPSLFQRHLDTLRYVEDAVFQSCRSSR